MLKTFAKKIYRWILRSKHNRIIREAFNTNNDKKAQTKRIIMFESPSYGNLGDHAIAIAEKRYVQEHFPSYSYIEITHLDYEFSKELILEEINDDDLILICGGGFLGSLWANAHNHVIDIVKSFPRNKMIQFPQTAYFAADKKSQEIFQEFNEVMSSKSNLDFFVRERNTYNYLNENADDINTFLVPDIAMYLEASQTLARKGVLFCLRQDKEKVNNNHVLKELEAIFKKNDIAYRITDTVVDKKLDYRSRKPYLDMKAKEFSESELVITDRLHGMIFALITGTPCIALDNKSKKVSGVYQWIKDDIEYIHLLSAEESKDINPQELEKIALGLIKKGGHIYNNDKAEKDFKPLEESLSRALEN